LASHHQAITRTYEVKKTCAQWDPILVIWDGLGLVSYLLVIYYQNVNSYGAGILTVLSNRIVDVALLIVIAWIINFGS
jgi:NADH-ubiquinone oxidoreductase chain 5